MKQKSLYKLAINGGEKLRKKSFPNQLDKILDFESSLKIKNEIAKVIDKKVFSYYRGNATDNFWGGLHVQALEKQIGDKFDTKALAVNSCTSALWIACAAIGLKPGDEVIVTPWSMTCSATIPMLFGATPIFADIEPNYFCLDPESIEEKITEKTKAIIVVDLFGQIANYKRIKEIANRYDLYIIEDAAQAIGAYKEENNVKNYAGTFGDIGCFSFTQGKHITGGEGGAIVTRDASLYDKCSLLRNHAEAVNNDNNEISMLPDNFNLVGMNLRMTEIQAIIILEQFKKLTSIVDERRRNAEKLNEIAKIIPYIQTCKERDKIRHAYYCLPFKFTHDKISRDVFIKAVKAELTEEKGRVDRGIPIGCGYIKPIYQMPLFKGNEKYKKGLCPVTEYLYEKELFLTLYQGLPLTDEDCDDIINAFRKVYENIGELYR